MAKSNTVKVKAAILNPARYAGEKQVFHFGHTCDVESDSTLTCDMDADMAAIEIAAGRFMAIEEKKDKKPVE